MSKSLSDRIATFMRKQPARKSGKTRASVIALRAEIQKALDDGWSVKAIWQTLHAEGSVEVGYHAFRRHVAALVPQQQAGARERQRASIPAAPQAKPPSRERHFHHDRIPQKKEIYG